MAITSPLVWPACLLKPASTLVQPIMQSRGGGAGVLGVEQVVQSPAWAWSIKLSSIPITTRQQILAWRSIEGQLDGRAGTILVPIYDWLRSPGGRSLVPYSDGTPHSDTSRFRGYAASIVLVEPAALNATALKIAWKYGVAPEAGQHFSIGQRLHRIVSVDLGDDASAEITIRPWLREAQAALTVLDFDNPVCVCRLEKDDGMTLDLELWKFATPSVSFVEAF